MAGGRFSVWSLVNGAQHSPSRVKSGPGAACYASRWDVAPGGPDRARSCHWPPLTPPRTTHCSTCPPCRLVPRVTSYPRRGSDVETVEHFSRGSRWYRSRRCSRSQDSRIARRSISITISTTIPLDVRLFFFFFLLRSILLSIFRTFFRCWRDVFVSKDFAFRRWFEWVDRIYRWTCRWKEVLDSVTTLVYMWYAKLFFVFRITFRRYDCYLISIYNVKSLLSFLSTTTTT